MLASAGGNEGSLSAQELQSVITQASARFAALYRGGVEGSDWKKALGALRSLRTLAAAGSVSSFMSDEARSLSGSDSVLEARLLAADAEALYGRGLETAAFLAYGDALAAGLGPEGGKLETAEKGVQTATPDSGAVPSSPGAYAGLEVWGKRALAARNRMALSLYSDYFRRAGIAMPDGSAALLASKDSISEMKKGVVTIRVDRGIKIQDGMGVPDRVLGTGFYIDRNGYILTNYHVISSEVDPAYEGYSSLSIRPSDSPEARIPGKVVGYDRLLDLAVIKVDTKPDYVFSFDLASEPQAGAHVYVIGSPVGLENTVTSGIVSAVGRRLLSTGSVIQIDAAVNPGNSGGPMLDEDGRVLGVAFAGLADYQGLNFAIPSVWIKKVLPDLMRGGELKRAWVGLSLTDFAAAQTDTGSGKGSPISPSPSTTGGSSAAQSAAAATGSAALPAKPSAHFLISYSALRMASSVAIDDYFMTIDGMSFPKLEDIQMYLLDRQPGELVSLGLRHADGREEQVLSALEQRPYSPLEQAVQQDRKERLFPVLFGIEVKGGSSSLLEPSAFTVSKVYPGSAADEGGLSENDPFSLRRFAVDKKQRAAFIQIHIKKRKAGFLDSIIQIGASLDSPDFI